MANKGKDTLSAADSSTGSAPPWLETHRTYTRSEVLARIPGSSDEFLSQLQEFFGLLPLGLREFVYHGENVIEALRNHARGEMVRRVRNPLPRDQVRILKREQKRSPCHANDAEK